MTLIERLQDPQTQWPSGDPCYLQLRVEAADRIRNLEAALAALWNETKLSGNDNSKDYGWPKVRDMVLTALGSAAQNTSEEPK